MTSIGSCPETPTLDLTFLTDPPRTQWQSPARVLKSMMPSPSAMPQLCYVPAFSYFDFTPTQPCFRTPLHSRDMRNSHIQPTRTVAEQFTIVDISVSENEYSHSDSQVSHPSSTPTCIPKSDTRQSKQGPKGVREKIRAMSKHFLMGGLLLALASLLLFLLLFFLL